MVEINWHPRSRRDNLRQLENNGVRGHRCIRLQWIKTGFKLTTEVEGKNVSGM
jgi:hypothetical protein